MFEKRVNKAVYINGLSGTGHCRNAEAALTVARVKVKIREAPHVVLLAGVRADQT